MLEKAVVAMKENKEKALKKFNKGEGGFRDRDLYVFCADARDGVLTRQEIMKNATEGTFKEVTYWWPRPGTEKPLEKRTFFTKVVGQNCGVGYYKS